MVNLDGDLAGLSGCETNSPGGQAGIIQSISDFLETGDVSFWSQEDVEFLAAGVGDRKGLRRAPRREVQRSLIDGETADRCQGHVLYQVFLDNHGAGQVFVVHWVEFQRVFARGNTGENETAVFFRQGELF